MLLSLVTSYYISRKIKQRMYNYYRCSLIQKSVILNNYCKSLFIKLTVLIIWRVVYLNILVCFNFVHMCYAVNCYESMQLILIHKNISLNKLYTMNKGQRREVFDFCNVSKLYTMIKYFSI